MSDVKKLYRVGLPFGVAFVSETFEPVTYIHENDAQWRDEYFRPIMQHLGVRVQYLGEMGDNEFKDALCDDDHLTEACRWAQDTVKGACDE